MTTATKIPAAWVAAHAPAAGVPRWARVAAYAVPLTVLPSSAWRIAACTFHAPIVRGDVVSDVTSSGAEWQPRPPDDADRAPRWQRGAFTDLRVYGLTRITGCRKDLEYDKLPVLHIHAVGKRASGINGNAHCSGQAIAFFPIP